MSWRRWVIVGVVVLGLLVGLVYWRTLAAWSEMESVIDAKQAQLSKPPESRPVLWGEAVPGNAFTDYDAAERQILAACEAIQPPTGSVTEVLEGWVLTPNLQSPAREQFLAQVQPALGRLRAGAHRQQGHRPTEWERGFSYKIDFDTMSHVADAAMVHARVLLESGKDVEAARTLLDVMQFGRDRVEDLQFLSSLIGGVLLCRPAEYLLLRAGRSENVPKGHVGSVLGDFSDEALDLLATGLARLDRALPDLRRVFDAETVLLVRQLALPKGIDGVFAGMALPTAWKLGFASRYLVADAVIRLIKTGESVPGTQTSWNEARDVLAGFKTKLESNFNPLMNLLAPQLEHVERGRRMVIAKLRLLRMAVAAARGKPQPLRDPFGTGPLRTKTVDGKTRFWSVGRDGVDNDGDPARDLVLVR